MIKTDQQYFRPRPDERTYEEAIERARYLIDGRFVTLTTGLTEDDLIEHIADMIRRQKQSNK